MTSTFPTCKSSSHSLKNGFKEIQNKKESLVALEAALKKRINEFRELCLKEGELTGHLPVDYPLQPREPIPQVRRRLTRSNGNLCDERVTNNIMTSGSIRSQTTPFAIPQPGTIFPSRPTSTNSTNSTTSSASSNTGRTHNNNVSAEGMNCSSINRVASAPDRRFNTDSNKLISINEVTNFQPYYEEAKPYQMSDFYKYSSKHRHRVEPDLKPQLPKLTSNLIEEGHKTTRQHQEEAARVNESLILISCDERIQASKKLFERSDKKLLEATAKAIACNPKLAEKLNINILSNRGERLS